MYAPKNDDWYFLNIPWFLSVLQFLRTRTSCFHYYSLTGSDRVVPTLVEFTVSVQLQMIELIL